MLGTTKTFAAFITTAFLGLGATGTAQAQIDCPNDRFPPRVQPFPGQQPFPNNPGIRVLPQFRPVYPPSIQPGFQPNIPVVQTSARYRYNHIDQLAVQLERQAREVHREVHLHFRNTAVYRHLDRDVAQMERLADHIHDVAHRGGSIAHIRADVNQLDRLFHHVEDLVEDLAHSGRVDRRTIVHLRYSLRRMENTLHHLRHDLN